MRFKKLTIFGLMLWLGCSCKEETNPGPTPPNPVASFGFNSLQVNKQFAGFDYRNVNQTPEIRFTFAAPLDNAALKDGISFQAAGGGNIPFNTKLEKGDSALIVTPSSELDFLTKYTVSVSKSLKSKNGGFLLNAVSVNLTTQLDSTDKFPRISDEALLTLVQRQTFKYFWDFAHPLSGLARERNTSGDVVTSGGSGFGIMTIPVAIERKFITRDQGLERTQKMVSFLKNNAQKFHGAFPHWLNGSTGAAIPFSTKDNGADLVETSLLMQGLLTARQYFNANTSSEANLRKDINSLWQAVEWDWFTKNENTLYWHWSPQYNWEMNHQIRGWNECLITYALAASSPSHAITKAVYDQGWTNAGKFVNGNSFFNIKLPLGENYGGPLFFSQYSFLGLNPTGLSDQYTNYFTQNKNHTLINYNYCLNNPQSFGGYSNSCWGLTASDIPNGYNANSPTNDKGVITPTAALSAFPYTPTESMRALRFFYYQLGDKLWGEYGFHDAFSLHELWFADSYLAIDQGPIVVMIENYRSQLPWKLFMSAPEVQSGLKKLGFSSPDIK